MRRAPHFLAVGAALLMLSAPAALAMSFGPTAMTTTLGQRLDFTARIALDVDETVTRECVAARVMVGDDRVAAENVRVALEGAREPGMQAIRVTTRAAVDEPVVTIDLTVGCSSQMTRRFVAFVDPPALALASAEPAEMLAPLRTQSQVAPLVDIVSHRDRKRAHAAVAAPRSTRSHVSRAAAPMRSTPRLRLDAAPALAAAPPTRTRPASPSAPASAQRGDGTTAAEVATASAHAATEASLASAAAALHAASAALAQERAHIRDLEAGVARLRADSLAQQKTVGALQARLRQAEGDRYLNGVVYFLAAAVAFLALLAAVFWVLRPRQRRHVRWFDAQAEQQKRAAAAAGASSSRPRSTTATQAPPVSQQPSQWAESGPAFAPVTAPATIGGLEVTTVLAPQSHYAHLAQAGASANAAAKAVTRAGAPSMEELIDLEQQAEFYVVLGQDEAAIALLTGHLGEIGAASPLPFLQLLEIHQRRGDRASYEAVREEYRDHFDAFAPEWSTDLHFGRSIEDYPEAVARLQALWPTPLHAMRTLDGLLFRRNEADQAFDFPAYRELLFLYSIARELAGQGQTDFGPIDVLLPLDDQPAPGSPRAGDEAAVDLDVSGWPDESRSEGTVIRLSSGARRAG